MMIILYKLIGVLKVKRFFWKNCEWYIDSVIFVGEGIKIGWCCFVLLVDDINGFFV